MDRGRMATESRTNPHVKSLVLDATPLITQPYTHYQSYAQSFYTTPTVFNEIRDEQARKNLEIWQTLGTLQLRHPKQESIDKVGKFARLTGDYSVLSANDIHILALAYELEVELNSGDWRLRQKPGDALKQVETKLSNEKKKNRRRGGKRQKAKREAEAKAKAEAEATIRQEDTTPEINDQVVQPATEISEEYQEEDDDGDWITPDNLTEAMIKDSGEDTTGALGVERTQAEQMAILSLPENQVALATGDFAVQNVALQLNLNLMNFMSGLKIKRLRNYMLRCHACFKMFSLPKDGKTKHFCPSCGGQNTLLRCAVSVDSETGVVTPHLKANFQWNNRGSRYSVPSPLSKNSQKRYGNKGHVHSKPVSQETILREDQKEYEQLMKQEDWTRRHNEKVLDNWIGGGSADNYISPFAISGLKHHSVQLGRGRHANSSKRRS